MNTFGAKVKVLTRDMLHISTVLAEATSSNEPYAIKYIHVSYWAERRKAVNEALIAAEAALAKAYSSHQQAQQ